MAGSVSKIMSAESPDVWKLTYTCTADSSDKTYPSTKLSSVELGRIFGWYLFAMKTNPGSTGPTLTTDITIKDGDGIDITGAVMTDITTSTSKSWTPKVDGTRYRDAVVDGDLTMAITGNSVASAVVVLQCWFRKRARS